MDLASLELQLQNNIIMYQRPSYPYIKEITNLLNWYNDWEGKTNNKLDWIFDAINLKKEIEREIVEIRFNNFRYSWYN